MCPRKQEENDARPSDWGSWCGCAGPGHGPPPARHSQGSEPAGADTGPPCAGAARRPSPPPRSPGGGSGRGSSSPSPPRQDSQSPFGRKNAKTKSISDTNTGMMPTVRRRAGRRSGSAPGARSDSLGTACAHRGPERSDPPRAVGSMGSATAARRAAAGRPGIRGAPAAIVGPSALALLGSAVAFGRGPA